MRDSPDCLCLGSGPSREGLVASLGHCMSQRGGRVAGPGPLLWAHSLHQSEEVPRAGLGVQNRAECRDSLPQMATRGRPPAIVGPRRLGRRGQWNRWEEGGLPLPGPPTPPDPEGPFQEGQSALAPAAAPCECPRQTDWGCCLQSQWGPYMPQVLEHEDTATSPRSWETEGGQTGCGG